MDGQLVSLVKSKATAIGLDPAVCCAIVEQESAWNQWAIRYEPAFYSRYIVPLHLADATEATARAISWGLFQTMGEVVRELGFKGPLSSLCDPDVGIDNGLRVWQSKLTKANGVVTKALLLWNGGSNPNYPAQVIARVPKYQ
jgi:soluble lytic murein transglycosylase-like protein